MNQNRISGFLDDTAVKFRLASGPEISIRKEKISKLVFRTRDNELNGIERNNIIVLTNGDVITGKVLNEMFRVKTTYATMPVKTGAIRHVAMISEKNALTTIKLKPAEGPGPGGESQAASRIEAKPAEDQIQGILEDEDIQVALDAGETITLYQDRIKEISFQSGYDRPLELPSSSFPAAGGLGGGAREFVS